MLEKMDDFFNGRVRGYEEHQLTAIAYAREFYPFTAECLPDKEGASVLDLGCGTGLELGYYFARNPAAKVTGIDMAGDMLKVLKDKFRDRALTVIQGSYFTVPLGADCYDAAVSVESLHHFTAEEKIPLYEKTARALRKNGYFVLTDYFAQSEEEERFFRSELLRLMAEQGIDDGQFYHFDTPLTLEHELRALLKAGFTSTVVLKSWGATATIKATK